MDSKNVFTVHNTHPSWTLYTVEFLRDLFSSHSICSCLTPSTHKWQNLFRLLTPSFIFFTFILFQVHKMYHGLLLYTYLCGGINCHGYHASLVFKLNEFGKHMCPAWFLIYSQCQAQCLIQSSSLLFVESIWAITVLH